MTSHINNKKEFSVFRKLIDNEVLNHPIIVQNHYTKWFSNGDMTQEELRDFIVQFSVFSNQFICAQLQKTINAPTIDHMRASKEILVNELGVTFKTKKKGDKNESSIDNTEMTVEGSIFRFRSAHFEWLFDTAKAIGLEFHEIGKRCHGNPNTLKFCDDLIDLYSKDYNTSQACSFIIENWASRGFWKHLISGLTKFNKKNNQSIPIGFFTWHDQIESQHAQHAEEELMDLYNEIEIDHENFVSVTNRMMDSLMLFWRGMKQPCVWN